MAGRRTVEPARLSIARIAAVAIPGAIVAVLVNLAIRALAMERFGVPAEALPLPGVIIGSAMPVLGPAFGFYMAFRPPTPNSMRNFLLVSALLTVMGGLIQLVPYSKAHHVGGLLVGEFQGLLATGLALFLLLRFVPRPAVPVRDRAGAP
jgi:hypothetical protein